jgi:AcrR family transcriptional regulator
MNETRCETMDPRIRRTRQLLQAALGRLLETKEFERISVQDIAEAATLNRATFYDHYPDKFALLECMVAARFHELLKAREVVFDAGCSSALRGIILGVCDYLAATPRLECERQRQMEPHLESSVIAVVRRLLVNGLKAHGAESAIPAEIAAATASWAIYGAAKEWVHTPNRRSSEEIVEIVMVLVSPILGSMQQPASLL